MSKICDSWNGNNDSHGIKTTREQQLEERIKKLEQENLNLNQQLFNMKAASKPYGQY